MSQTNTSTPNPQASVQPPPVKKRPNNEWVHRILFFVFFFLILLFYSNLLVTVILATLVNLLSISIFDPIPKQVLKFFEELIEKLRHPSAQRSTPPDPKSPGQRTLHFHQFVPIIITLIITIVMLTSTILRPEVATLFGNLNDSVCSKTSFPWPTCDSGLGISSLPDGVHIGLITDNTHGTFDQTMFNQDEIKVEGLIFGENHHACTGQHVTLVAVTMLSRTVEDPLSGAKLGSQDLQGYFLAQQSYNATHPAFPLCLAIANLGTPDTANNMSTLVKGCSACYSMPTIIHQIAQFAHVDKSVRGIVGFPYSQQVTEALQIKSNELSLASLPIISPSASSSYFSNIPNFYRLNLPNQIQGAVMAQFFCNSLVQKRSSSSVAVLTDPTDPYSGDLAINFQNHLTCIDPAKEFPSISYKNYDAPSIQSAVDKALQNHVSYIFFPGYDEDLDTVETEVYKDSPPGKANTVTIIGGDGINDVDVATHYSYTHIYAANFAQPLSTKDSFVRNFLQDGFGTYQTPGIDSSSFWLPTGTLLVIDAVQAFMNAQQTLPSTQNDFDIALKTVNFQGETGSVTFQGNSSVSGHISDRTREDVYITCYDTEHILHLVDAYTATTDTTLIQEDSSVQNRTSCS